MAKLKNPLLSLGARGDLGKAFTFLRRRKQNIVERKPIPDDPQSLAQLSWRHMFLKVVALWHSLTPAEQKEWESNARPHHLTGYQWFISQALRPNPGIYLPLQGGTMQGNIDMAANRILHLPAPVDNDEPARKIDITPGIDIIGLANQVSVVSDNNRTATLGWTDLDLTAQTSPDAKAVLLVLKIHVDSITAGSANYGYIKVRKNGTTSGWETTLWVDGGFVSGGSRIYTATICGLDTDEVMEYTLVIAGTAQIDFEILLNAYIE